MRNPVITLTTDFGFEDPFVGIMKGVILSICPEVQIVDVAHEVPPQCILGAAFILRESFSYFPHGTIHVAVVDPGVGSVRKPIIARTDHYFFVGPDNGIFGGVEQTEPIRQVVAITNPDLMLPSISNTFHGRDIFAPAAAHLAAGKDLSEFGPTCPQWVRLDYPKPKIDKTVLVGQIIWVDRFGNLITNISQTDFEQWIRGDRYTIVMGSTEVDQIRSSYASVQSGQVVAIFGSSGFLELAINRGSAAHILNGKRGDCVHITREAYQQYDP